MILTGTIVTYWPSLEPSIKRCTCVNNQRNSGNRCIRSKISEYHFDLWTWLNSVQMHTSTGSRWMSNNYITRCHRRLEAVGVRVAVLVGDKMPEWEPAPDRELGSSGPTVEQLSQNEEEVLLSEELWVNMWQSIPVSSSPLTHNQYQPFRIKRERYIFIKKRVRSFFEVVIMFLFTFACIWIYNTMKNNWLAATFFTEIIDVSVHWRYKYIYLHIDSGYISTIFYLYSNKYVGLVKTWTFLLECSTY